MWKFFMNLLIFYFVRHDSFLSFFYFVGIETEPLKGVLILRFGFRDSKLEDDLYGHWYFLPNRRATPEFAIEKGWNWWCHRDDAPNLRLRSHSRKRNFAPTVRCFFTFISIRFVFCSIKCEFVWFCLPKYAFFETTVEIASLSLYRFACKTN